MKIKRMLIWVLPALAAVALAGLNCGEKADPSTFEARDPVWSAKNPGVTKTQNYCDDKVDNDGDGTADYYGVPPHCAETDVSTCIYEPDLKCAREVGGVLSEGEAACSDNLDNDGDTTVDKADEDCWSAYFYPWWDQAERGDECVDGVDNDIDGLRDYPDDPSCYGVSDYTEDSPYITTGTDGICSSIAAFDDTQLIAVGKAKADTTCVTDGGNLVLLALVGDDGYLPALCTPAVDCTSISSGPNGICETAAIVAPAGDDTQVIPVGGGQPNVACVDTGPNDILDTTPNAADLRVSK